jgi:hypothetical protein
MTMGSHHSARSKSTVWLTPPGILDALGPFDLDPCGHEGWPTAANVICPPRDGLTEPWTGRAWVNPPYREVGAWLARLADHGDGIALIFARTETTWFVNQVWAKATAVKFLHGRLHFHHPEGYRAHDNAGAPSVLVAYGARNAEILQGSRIPGTYLPIERTTT